MNTPISFQKEIYWPSFDDGDDDKQSFDIDYGQSVSSDSLSSIYLPTTENVSDEYDDIFDKVTRWAGTDPSTKPNARDYDELSWAKTIVAHSPSQTSNIDDYILLHPSEKDDKFNDENLKSLNIGEYLPAGADGNEFGNIPLPQQQLENDFEIISNRQIGMRFENDPTKKFRGRLTSDFKPKNNITRSGKPSKPRPPRYHTTENPRQYLNLLTPKEFLSVGLVETLLEIAIVTTDNNGCIFFHPGFKLQDPSSREFKIFNPIYTPIDPTKDLKSCEDELYYKTTLKLVVVMLTNNELMKAEQPLQIFQTLEKNPNGIPITMKYNKQQEFKDTYRLQEMRIAITIWQKTPDETEYHRCIDKQYISSVSIAAKNPRKKYVK